MKDVIRLIRPKDWAKNLFMFLPIFFAGNLFDPSKYLQVLPGFLAFCLAASSIYIYNDIRDVGDDRKHPEKRMRPIASGKVSLTTAYVLAIVFLLSSLVVAYYSKPKFLFILSIYLVINLGYCLGLKKISVLDIMLIAIGFVLRVKGGAVLAGIGLSEWLTIMVFLMALFMAIGKRRDDVLLKASTGEEMRRSINGYNKEFLDVMLSLVCAVIIVAYFMYTMSPDVNQRMGTYRLYYTCLFILAGIFRYLQIIFVEHRSGSPTKILYRDRFIQLVLILWVLSFYVIIYMRNITFFQ